MTGFTEFATMRIPTLPSEVAPDGSAARILLGLAGGTMAHFELPAGATSRAVTHRRRCSLAWPKSPNFCPREAWTWDGKNVNNGALAHEESVAKIPPGVGPQFPQPWNIGESEIFEESGQELPIAATA